MLETEKDRSEIHQCRSIVDPPEKDANDRRSTGEVSMAGLIGDRGGYVQSEMEEENIAGRKRHETVKNI